MILQINLKIYLLLFVLWMIGCKNTRENNINEVPSFVNQPNYSDFDGFYIFKKNMSIDNFKSELNKRNIRFYELSKIIDYNDAYFHNSFFNIHFTTQDLYRNLNNVRIFEIYNLNILGITLPSLRSCFVNDTIMFMSYNSNLEKNFNQKFFTKEEIDFEIKFQRDLNYITNISEGLEKKYGYPYYRFGNLKSFPESNKPTFYDVTNNYEHKSYINHDTWVNKDSTMQIRLSNDLVIGKDLNNNTGKANTYTNISILFNTNLALLLEKIIELQNNIENKKNSLKLELEESLKQRQIDSL